jgi:hypothetical protein
MGMLGFNKLNESRPIGIALLRQDRRDITNSHLLTQVDWRGLLEVTVDVLQFHVFMRHLQNWALGSPIAMGYDKSLLVQNQIMNRL